MSASLTRAFTDELAPRRRTARGTEERYTGPTGGRAHGPTSSGDCEWKIALNRVMPPSFGHALITPRRRAAGSSAAGVGRVLDLDRNNTLEESLARGGVEPVSGHRAAPAASAPFARPWPPAMGQRPPLALRIRQLQPRQEPRLARLGLWMLLHAVLLKSRPG